MLSCNPPALIPTDGEWEKTINFLYSIFLHDFMQNPLSFQNQPININKGIANDGREHLFWHLIGKTEKDNRRYVDFSRCERLAWSRYILLNCVSNCNTIKIWAKNHEKTKSTRVYIWCEAKDYIIILEKRTKSFFFITAFNTTYAHKRKELLADYNNWIKTKTPIL